MDKQSPNPRKYVYFEKLNSLSWESCRFICSCKKYYQEIPSLDCLPVGENKDLLRDWKITLEACQEFQLFLLPSAPCFPQDEDLMTQQSNKLLPRSGYLLTAAIQRCDWFWLKVDKPNNSTPLLFLLILVLKGQLLILNLSCHGCCCCP